MGYNLIEQILNADDVDYATLFDDLFPHTTAHFERENNLMEGSAYPAIGVHRGEHTRVLGEFEQFRKRVQWGLIPFGRAFVPDSVPAFPHIRNKAAASA